MKQSRLGRLSQRLRWSGIDNNSIITDAELDELHIGLLECSRFMSDRNDLTMASALEQEAESVARVIAARADYK